MSAVAEAGDEQVKEETEEKTPDVLAAQGTDVDPLQEEAKPEVAKPEPPEASEEFDKERQKEQQELGNARRRITELEASTSQQPSTTPAKETDDEPDPMEVLAEVKRQTDDMVARQQVMETAQTNADLKVAYSELFTGLDKEYGGEHRNPAIQWAVAEAKRRGYNLADNVPSPSETADLYRMGYMQSKASSGDSASPVTKRAVKTDTAKTSTVVKSYPSTGTPEEVMEAMKKEGKFSNLLVEE